MLAATRKEWSSALAYFEGALAASPLPQRHSLRDREALLFVVPCVLLPERGLEEEAVPLASSSWKEDVRRAPPTEQFAPHGLGLD